MVKIENFFVQYKGTKAQFIEKGLASTYAGKIVFIGNGECIYAQGNYFGSMADFLAAVNFVKGINVGGSNYNAAVGGGYIKFAATDPATLALNVNQDGVTIGLTSDFVELVNAYPQAIAEAKAELLGDANTDTIESKTIEGLYKRINEKTAGIATNENLAALTGRVDAIEGDYLKGADGEALQDQITANAQAIAKLNGSASEEGSVAKAVADGIAGVIASAPEDFDTLKEIADYIASDKTGATEINNKLSKIESWAKNIVGTEIENDELTLTEGNYVNAGDTYEGAIDKLDQAIKNVEGVANEAKGKADTAVQSVNGKTGTAVTLNGEDVTLTNDYNAKANPSDLVETVSSTSNMGEAVQTALDNEKFLANYINGLFTWTVVEA